VSIGADLTLTGSSFGATHVGSVITLQGIAPDPPVVVKSWSDTSIVLTVWIKWRDAEALMRAYSDGAVGGSALMEDVHSNLIRLINERREYLQSLLP